jgi:hypothetical protein
MKPLRGAEFLCAQAGEAPGFRRACAHRDTCAAHGFLASRVGLVRGLDFAFSAQVEFCLQHPSGR